VFAIGEAPFVEELQRAGFTICEDPERIEWVIASFDRTFDYRKVCIAYEALKRGAYFVATNPDRTCPIEGGELPDCAGMIAHLEAVTLRKVEAIVGKPSPFTIEAILELLDLPASACLLVGDRIETDIRMGKEAGMKTALVMTGVTDAKMLESSPVRPDYVLQSIADLEGLLR
jgi:arabinose operon protein AraL